MRDCAARSSLPPTSSFPENTRPARKEPPYSSTASALTWASSEAASTSSSTRAHPPIRSPRRSTPTLRRDYALGAFQEEQGSITIWLEQSRLSEPDSVVSTLAHELGHVHLLADKRCDPSTPDHEPLTDLLTVYFGLGVFVANNAIREVNWRSGNVEGWSLSRQGYMTIAEHAYALAVYSRARGEHKPRWVRYLRPDVRTLIKTELKRLASSGSSASTIARSAPGLLEHPGTVEHPPPPGEVETLDHSLEQTVDVETGEDGITVLEESGLETARTADGFFTQGTLHASQGEHQLALDAFSRSLQLNPSDPEAWLQRAESHLALGRYTEAIDDCGWSLAYGPDELAGLFCRAQASLWLGRYDLARIDMDRARRFANRDPHVYYLRGLAHLGLGNNRRAIADLKQSTPIRTDVVGDLPRPQPGLPGLGKNQPRPGRSGRSHPPRARPGRSRNSRSHPGRPTPNRSINTEVRM